MDLVEFGGARLHVHVAMPGIPGEADRVKRAIASLDPAIIVADIDTQEALSLRTQFVPSFVDGLVAHEANRRFAKGDPAGDHPLVATARLASTHKADLIALRPTAKRPNFFARRRAAAALVEISADDPRSFAIEVSPALAKAQVWRAREDAEAALPRLERALDGGRAPVAIVTQAHRADALLTLMGRGSA